MIHDRRSCDAKLWVQVCDRQALKEVRSPPKGSGVLITFCVRIQVGVLPCLRRGAVLLLCPEVDSGSPDGHETSVHCSKTGSPRIVAA